VGGSKEPAENGKLLFFVGGDASDVEVCQPLFAVMGRQTYHLGEVGMGATMKMVFNSIMGASMLAFCEAAALGQSLGLSQKTLFDILGSTPMMAPFIAPKRAKFESGQYDTEFPLQWLRKDLQLATNSAYEQDLALPFLNLAKEIYTQAMRAGLAEDDYSAIYAYVTGQIKES
jgi:3-hydroxyisobutyrate dehydrogenase/glyoxylate/succinic semialdehyde reductase